MYKVKIKRCMFQGVLLIALAFGLSGCFKANFSVDVKSDGSGSVGIAFGITQEVKDLFASQGMDPWQEIDRSIAEEMDNPSSEDVKVTRWTEGEYDWVKSEMACKDLDEINTTLSEMELFKSFSLTRKPGIFRTEFILEGELSEMGSDPSLAASGVDASAFIEMNFSARLPGTIVETNGSADEDDPNLVSWRMTSSPVPVKARSVAWNWLNLSGACIGGVGFVLFGMYALGGFDSILYPKSRNKKPLPQDQQASSQSQQPLPPLPQQDQQPMQPAPRSQQPLQPLPQSQPALQALPPQTEKRNTIADLNVENLLLQINTHALNSAGQLHKRLGEIALVWNDTNGRQRFIDVKELGNDQISINGQACPATKENVKAGLVSALQKQRT